MQTVNIQENEDLQKKIIRDFTKLVREKNFLKKHNKTLAFFLLIGYNE